MFQKLTDFAYKRGWKEAIGFYITYLVLTLIIAVLLGGIIGNIFSGNNAEIGFKVGNIVAIAIAVGVTFMVIYKKRFAGNYTYTILIVASGILAVLGGGLLGLIPAAYITTKERI